MTTESLIQSKIRVALSQDGHIVFRANVGKVRMTDGRFFDTGLPNGCQVGCQLSNLTTRQI